MAGTTQANGINSQGDIVGFYTDINSQPHGFLLRKGTFSKIDVPSSAGSQTNAQAINSRGDIVGSYFDSSGPEHGFLLSQGRFTKIDVPGSELSEALGINRQRDLVGVLAVRAFSVSTAFCLPFAMGILRA
jgi:probable HAF family extracellular repeat protein